MVVDGHSVVSPISGVCETVWNTSFEIVFHTVTSNGRSQCRFVMVRVSPSHPYNAVRAQDSDGGGCKYTLRAVVVVLCIVFVTMLPDTVDDSSTSTTCWYLSPSQLCLIKRVSNFKVSQLNVGYSYSTFSLVLEIKGQAGE